MKNAILTGTVFDGHTFRGQAFAHSIGMLHLFENCSFQPFGAWNVPSGEAPIAIYITGAIGLSDATHCKNIKEIQDVHPDMPIIAMCDVFDHDDIEAAVHMNLRAIIPTDFAQDIVLAVFSMVLAGGRYFPFLSSHQSGDDTGFTVLSHGESAPDPADDDLDDTISAMDLTQRQTDVLVRLRQGLSNKHIARDLDLAEATVKIYVRQLLRKFQALNRTQIVVNAAAYPISGDCRNQSFAGLRSLG